MGILIIKIILVCFCLALFLLFLGLKLGGAINWSWWYVTSPVWFLTIPDLCYLIFGEATYGKIN